MRLFHESPAETATQLERPRVVGDGWSRQDPLSLILPDLLLLFLPPLPLSLPPLPSSSLPISPYLSIQRFPPPRIGLNMANLADTVQWTARSAGLRASVVCGDLPMFRRIRPWNRVDLCIVSRPVQSPDFAAGSTRESSPTPTDRLELRPPILKTMADIPLKIRDQPEISSTLNLPSSNSNVDSRNAVMPIICNGRRLTDLLRIQCTRRCSSFPSEFPQPETFFSRRSSPRPGAWLVQRSGYGPVYPAT